jgi:uncharacterized protein (DUF983 family)
MQTGGHKHVTSPACAVMHGDNEVWSIKCIIKAESALLKHCLLHYHFIISAPDTAKKQHITFCVLVFIEFNSIRVINITYHKNYWLNIQYWLHFIIIFRLLTLQWNSPYIANPLVSVTCHHSLHLDRVVQC